VRSFSTSSNTQIRWPPFVGCLWVFIKYIGTYLPYVEAVYYIRNQWKLDASVTGLLYYGTNPLTKCNSPVGFFAQSFTLSVSIPLIHSQSISLTHPVSSSPLTLTSILSLARNHFPSHKLDHSFVVNSRSRPTCNVLPVRPGIYELAHVSSQLNNSVLLVIWIFHWDSYRNQSDGSDGRTDAQCCKVRSICWWIALAIIQ